MSIVNIVVRPDRIVAAVDTEVVIGHERMRVGKMTILPHMCALLAFRGTILLGTTLSVSAMAFSSFDEINAQFEVLIKNTCTALVAGVGVSSVPGAGLGLLDVVLGEDQEIFLAGWSEQRARMEASLWRQKDGNGFEQIPIEWGIYSPTPNEDADTPIDAPETIDDHVAIAKAQTLRLRAQGFTAGGDLVVATVTRGRIVVDIVKEFCGVLGSASAPTRTLGGNHGRS